MVAACGRALRLGRGAADCVLLFLGAALVVIALNGTVHLYLAPSMRWPVLIAGLLIMGLAAADAALGGGENSHSEGHRHSHVHSHDPARLPWLLLVPGALLLFVVPGPIGADASDEYTVRSGAMYSGPLPPGNAPEISIQELWVRAERPEDHSLDGRELTLTGQVLDDGGRPRIGRVIITCCAADAKTISAGVSAESAHLLDGIAPGEWVRAVVSESPRDNADPSDGSPTVAVRDVLPIDPPDSPYETPR
ncbi:TIGR03943 family putative permease subunit [Dietzia timorensis]|uniref:TIGR03943 family protein n=1 Tax=Dietzia timorensis TaxID=499555 RepID=A0A173LIU5_9ACTN|nr:TIGR03943 family protein [Dietzia timorensis]ANI91448.1 Hypothetical protein BJL86_0646 [Dietzia timorensis]